MDNVNFDKEKELIFNEAICKNMKGHYTGALDKVKEELDKIPSTNATAEVIDARGGKATLGEKVREISSDLETITNNMKISVKKFGARGDCLNDDTIAIQQANDYCFENNLVLHFPYGVYICTDGIDKKCDWVGDGIPSLGTFPLDDDKIYLREGYKHKLKGSVLLFKGDGAKRVITQRTDEFSSFNYCVKTLPGKSYNTSDIAIVQDMICKNSNNAWTLPNGDNKSNYDVGYMIDDSFRNMHDNFVVFGYFNKAGILIHGREKENYLGDADYNSFSNGSVSGNIGLAITGSQSQDGEDGGLSGTRFNNFQIFSKDHHSRDKVADDWGKCCIYIDGFTQAVLSDINGHYFTQCCIRTYGTNPLIFNQATNISFVQTVFETPDYGTPNSQETEFLATENTMDVSFICCRFSGLNGISKNFGSVITKLILIGEPYDDLCVINKGLVARLGNENDKPFIQFSNNLSSKTQGFKIQSDLSTLSLMKDNISFKEFYSDGSIGYNGSKSGGSKTIVDSSITIGNYSFYNIDNDGTNNNLHTINGGAFIGQRLTLRSATNTRPFNLIRQTGNIRMKTDLAFTNIFDRAELEFDGTYWVLISFSDNA